MKAMLLSSMGYALDNVNAEPPYAFYYVSFTNDIIYNPSQKKLFFVKKGCNSPPNSNEVLVELPLIHDQYFKNAFSNRVYKWDAIENDMIETTIPASEIDVLFTAMLKSDESIHIGETKQPETLSSNKLIVFDGGKYDNFLLTGSNNIIVALNDNVIFNNCEFAGTFCYSSLKATNFGCVSGITETSINWEYGAEPHLTTENGVKQYGGTDNTNALNSIGQFCSGSDHVKIEFNGNFFSINAN
ncbi:MAG: hypothetical protein IK092_03205, partial [Muribaculaceae bacterium]|nr:hypothetical protein [Muribaculaceae bacterium]